MVRLHKRTEKVYKDRGNPVYVAMVEGGVVVRENAYDPTGATLVWNTRDGSVHRVKGRTEEELLAAGYTYVWTTTYYLTEQRQRYTRGEGCFLPDDDPDGPEYTLAEVEIVND